MRSSRSPQTKEMFYQQQYHSQGNFLEADIGLDADEEAMLIDEQQLKKPMPESPLNKLFTKVAAAQQQVQHSQQQKHNFQQPQKQLGSKSNPQPQQSKLHQQYQHKFNQQKRQTAESDSDFANNISPRQKKPVPYQQTVAKQSPPHMIATPSTIAQSKHSTSPVPP